MFKKAFLINFILFYNIIVFAQSDNYKRPQHPSAPYPYKSLDVFYDHPSDTAVRFGATLTLPEGKGPFPAALLISGSGQSERDMTVNGHKMMLVIADYLTRRGIAVLRFDDRGAGQSTSGSKKLRELTGADLNADAQAGVNFLKTRSEIDKTKIGIIGHSAGSGNAVSLAKVPENQIAYIVLMAGANMTPLEIFTSQTQHIARLKGASPAALQSVDSFLEKSLFIVKNETDGTIRKEQLNAIALKTLSALDTADANLLKDQLLQRAKDLSLAFFHQSANSNSQLQNTFKQVTCPVLCINGGKDVLVPGEKAAASFREALKGHKDYQVQLFPKLNHLFQVTPTGFMEEGKLVEETFNIEALRLLGDWITTHTLHK